MCYTLQTFFMLEERKKRSEGTRREQTKEGKEGRKEGEGGRRKEEKISLNKVWLEALIFEHGQSPGTGSTLESFKS